MNAVFNTYKLKNNLFKCQYYYHLNIHPYIGLRQIRGSIHIERVTPTCITRMYHQRVSPVSPEGITRVSSESITREHHHRVSVESITSITREYHQRASPESITREYHQRESPATPFSQTIA